MDRGGIYRKTNIGVCMRASVLVEAMISMAFDGISIDTPFYVLLTISWH